MKAVIYGSSDIGLLCAEHFMELNNVIVIGAGDPDKSRAEMLSARCNCPAFTDWKQMMDKKDPDIVCLFMGTSKQKELIIDALERNKYVISNFVDVDKKEDVEYMLNAVKRGKLYLLKSERCLPHNIDLRNRVLDGAVGKPGVIHIKRYITTKTCNGELPDDLLSYTINDIDFLLWTVSRLESVYVMRQTRSILDYITVTLKFESGCIANIESFYGYPGETYKQVEIAGNNGVLRYDSRKTYALQIHTYDKSETKAKMLSPSYRKPLAREVSKILSNIYGSGKSAVSMEEIALLLNVLVAVKNSVSSNKPVEIGGILNA